MILNSEVGGSAFPMVGEGYAREGMTLRDYFAAKALPLAYKYWMEDFYHPDNEDTDARNQDGRNGFSDNADLIADDCYFMADAMLRARKE